MSKGTRPPIDLQFLREVGEAIRRYLQSDAGQAQRNAHQQIRKLQAEALIPRLDRAQWPAAVRFFRAEREQREHEIEKEIGRELTLQVKRKGGRPKLQFDDKISDALDALKNARKDVRAYPGWAANYVMVWLREHGVRVNDNQERTIKRRIGQMDQNNP